MSLAMVGATWWKFCQANRNSCRPYSIGSISAVGQWERFLVVRISYTSARYGEGPAKINPQDLVSFRSLSGQQRTNPDFSKSN